MQGHLGGGTVQGRAGCCRDARMDWRCVARSVVERTCGGRISKAVPSLADYLIENGKPFSRDSSGVGQDIRNTMKAGLKLSKPQFREETAGTPHPVEEPKPAGDPDSVELKGAWLCPKCGSWEYIFSRRRWFDRFFLRPAMAQCLRCGNRFPHPAHRALRKLRRAKASAAPVSEQVKRESQVPQPNPALNTKHH